MLFTNFIKIHLGNAAVPLRNLSKTYDECTLRSLGNSLGKKPLKATTQMGPYPSGSPRKTIVGSFPRWKAMALP